MDLRFYFANATQNYKFRTTAKYHRNSLCQNVEGHLNKTKSPHWQFKKYFAKYFTTKLLQRIKPSF